MEDSFPDLGALSDAELKELIQKLTEEEEKVSYTRRILHGKIDILRAELVNRLRKRREEGEAVISGADVQQLTDILAGRVVGDDPGERQPELAAWRWSPGGASLHCPECGFINNAGANFCQKCGAHLPADDQERDQTTLTYRVGETGELTPVDIEDVTAEGGALVIRTGGGRAGESFAIEGDRMTIGRSPDANVFLDDVTVSRNHALLVRRRDGLYIDDLGSLNGTYVNRRRIESHRLQNGDELQVGKYKLTYLER